MILLRNIARLLSAKARPQGEATQAEDHRGSQWQHIKQRHTLLHISTTTPQRLKWQQCGGDICAARRSHQRQKTCSSRKLFLHQNFKEIKVSLVICLFTVSIKSKTPECTEALTSVLVMYLSFSWPNCKRV